MSPENLTENPTEEDLPIETRAPIPSDVSKQRLETTPLETPEARVENIFRIRQEQAEVAANNARLELEHLKKLLSEQEAARRHAQKTATAAHGQLKLFEADSSRVRRELQRAKDEFALATQEHEAKIQRAAERESSLRSELVEARILASTARESALRHLKKWFALSLGILVPAILWAAVGRWHPNGGIAPSSGPHAASPGTVAAAPQPTAAGTEAKVSPHDFTGALDRLDHSLSYFKGARPEDVLRHVHKENAAHGISVCSFDWNGGQVSLLFGGEETDPQNAILRCAEAVEKAATK